ncbi:MAG: dihydrolipoyl dehydrogenase [Pseudobdellovibrionaceae bacterium]|nr:dihydrolipoyl dehydrogenase [Pseudobdellovibrionaceae bacterium]
MLESYDVIVIGAGPGGYVCAIRCAQNGLRTGIVEREFLGGVCLNVGCIPSKAMISAAHFFHRLKHDASAMGIHVNGVSLEFSKLKEWKQSVCQRMSQGVSTLLKGNKVDVFWGDAQFTSDKELKVVSSSKETVVLKAKNFVIATGSRPVSIPGFEYDETHVLSSTGALNLDQLPDHLLIIGGGYIGLEIGGYLADLGSKITVLEAGSSFLTSVVDPDCAQVVVKKMQKKGVTLITEALAKSYRKTKNGKVILEYVHKNRTEQIEGDKILVTVGRKPNTDAPLLKNLNLTRTEQGFIKTDPQRRTSIGHIFAIGDIAGQPMLAHKASYEGILVADVLAGKNRVYDAKCVPSVVFTDPEIASVGLTETQAKSQGYPVLVGKFPFAANGRAVSMMHTEGFVKMVADQKNHVVLGVHIVGPEASNLISEAALAIEMGARLEDLALTIHPHPTLGETLMEAAEVTLGHGIHILQPEGTKRSTMSRPIPESP